MKSNERGRGGVAGLIALNGGLLCLLGLITFGASADGQVRPRGSYTMVAGRANGAMGDVVYIADTINQELIALTFDPNERQLSGIGYQNLAAASRVVTRRPGG